MDDTKLWKDLPATQWFAQGNVSIFQDDPLISYSRYDYVILCTTDTVRTATTQFLCMVELAWNRCHVAWTSPESVPLIGLWQEVL